MNGKRNVIATALSLLLLITAVGPAVAGELDDKLDNIQQQMQVQQNQATKAQQQVDSVSEQLRHIQTEMDAAQGEYNNIQAQLSQTEQQIKVNAEILAKAEKDLAQRSTILNKRMRDIYENGQINYLDVLLGSRDFADFSTRMDLLSRILKQDTDLVIKVKAERALILEKRGELERDRASILELKKAADDKKNVIASRKQDRERVLSSAINERDAAERAYQELQETSRQIQEMIRSQSGRRGGGAVSGTGALMWPTAATVITSPFGTRTHPIFGTTLFHSGIDIGADYGDTVVAADSGTVIYSGWMGGYGKAVIIDHNNGLQTLYGHNSELLVSEGQQVRKGQPISRVGATGYATGPHLHFEVRVNGEPVDPMGYL